MSRIKGIAIKIRYKEYKCTRMFILGHYEADVYNVTTRKWNHLNDEVVTSETEEEVTGFSQQKNGYAFLYIYK